VRDEYTLSEVAGFLFWDVLWLQKLLNDIAGECCGGPPYSVVERQPQLKVKRSLLVDVIAARAGTREAQLLAAMLRGPPAE